MKKNCRMVEEKLLDYIEGKLPRDTIKIFEEHRKRCVQCDLLIKNFIEIWSSISENEKVQPSDSFWPGLQAKIQAVERPQPLSDRIFSDLKMILRPAALTIILLAGIFLGYQMGNITDVLGDISNSKTLDSERPEKAYVENYFQDFQEIPIGSPAEFYLQPASYKKD